MKKSTWVSLRLMLLVGGVVCSFLRPSPVTSDPATGVAGTVRKAMWKDVYETAEHMIADVDAIVVATNTGSQAGRVVAEKQGGLLPFTLNFFRLDRVFKGTVHEGEELILEQTGGFGPAGMRMSIDDGGPYVAGERYLLFLQQQQDTSYYYLVNPQGRYLIKDNILTAVDPSDLVAAEFHSLSESAAERMIKGILAK